MPGPPRQHLTEVHDDAIEALALEIVGDVLELDPGARDDFIAARCAAPTLGNRVRALLSHADTADGFLASPLACRDLLSDRSRRGLAPGTRVGRYTITDLVGSGAMGDVYRAEAPSPPSPVAIKIVRPGAISAELRRRFDFEVGSLARLNHPNIARLLDSGTFAGEEGERPFLVMQLIEGGPITRHARENALPVRDLIPLMIKICDGVEHAHRNAIIHRDLKPGNVLFDTARSEPVIVDFGVARGIDPHETLSSSPGGRLIGSLPYMSPEQAAGHGVDTRADVYALGAILFELVCGRPPHLTEGRSLPELMASVREASVPRARQVGAPIGRELEDIIAMALARDPARRYQSAAALGDDLRRFLRGEPISARPPGAWYLLRTLARRHRTGLSLTLMGSLAVTAALVIAGVSHIRARSAEARSDLLLNEAVRGARSMIVELNRRMSRESQPLQARRASLEASISYLNGVRDRAGDDPRVLEAIAETYLELGAIVGSAGAASLGLRDLGREMFVQSEALYRELLREQDTNARREGLGESVTQLAILGSELSDEPIRFAEAADQFRIIAERLPPGAEREMWSARSRIHRLYAATSAIDMHAMHEVVAELERAAADAPEHAERQAELGLGYRYLCELLMESDPPAALLAADRCAQALVRAMALGEDNFSSRRHLAKNALDRAALRVGREPAEVLIAESVEALRESRRLLADSPLDNLRRGSHSERAVAFARCAVRLAAAPPAPGQRLSAAEIRTLTARIAGEDLELLLNSAQGDAAPLSWLETKAIDELRSLIQALQRGE